MDVNTLIMDNYNDNDNGGKNDEQFVNEVDDGVNDNDNGDDSEDMNDEHVNNKDSSDNGDDNDNDNEEDDDDNKQDMNDNGGDNDNRDDNDNVQDHTITANNKTIPEDEEEEEGSVDACGCGAWRPGWLQKLRSPNTILILLSFGFIIQPFATSGLVPTTLTSLQRQFSLSSTEAGIMVASHEIAAVFCVVPIAYLANKGNKPRWLGFGFILFGIGSLVYTIPHYASQLYNPNNSATTISQSVNSSLQQCSSQPKCEDQSEVGGSMFFYVFILSQSMMGIGAAGMFSLGVPYMDESVHPKDSPVYVAILMATGLVGTAIGFGGGGQLLNIYTDFDRVDVGNLDSIPGDSIWVGAWWPGFLVCGVLSIIDGCFLLLLPREMPGVHKYRKERNAQQHQTADQNIAEQTKREMWNTVRVIVINPMFACLMIVAGLEAFLVGGYGAFLAKYIEYEFTITPAMSGIYTGLCLVVGGGVGTVVGGVLAKKLNLTCKRTCKFCIIVSFFFFPGLFSFLYHCPRTPIVGVTKPYLQPMTNTSLNLTATCNEECSCVRQYSPVCEIVSNNEFLSSCHAGCRTDNLTHCTCLDAGIIDTEDTQNLTLTSGRCPTNCGPFLPVFLISALAVIITLFTTSTPIINATMRSIPENQRAFGLGILSFVGRLIGYIPGPIAFGAFIDVGCQIWEEIPVCNTESQKGACQVYDLNLTGVFMLLFGLVPKALCIGLFILANYFYQAPKAVEEMEGCKVEIDEVGELKSGQDNNAYVTEDITDSTKL